MARIRTIKPEFFTSEDIVSVTPLARLFYVSLWCEADREGRLEWKPGTFKIRYLPGDDCSVESLAQELTDRGLVVLYEVAGRKYAEIPSFTRHQVINNRESPSSLPSRADASRTRAPRVKAEGRKEGRKGMEGNGTRVADAFQKFWDAWPKSERKHDRAKCQELFSAEGCAEALPAVLADVELKKQTEKWRGGFIEAPEVYLRNRRWEDGATPGFDLAASGDDWQTQRGVEAIAARFGLPGWDGCVAFDSYRRTVRAAAEAKEAA